MLYVFVIDLFIQLNLDVFNIGNYNYKKWTADSEYFNKVYVRQLKITNMFNPILERLIYYILGLKW
jgi:hypothetical protein